MTAESARVWRVPPEADLRHRSWDGEHVFYHGAAGDTYRLSEAAAAVLLRLMRGEADEQALFRELLPGDGTDAVEAHRALADLLAELARLECVEPLP
jgi:PqqD family protein of HPr-rel-A system